MAQEDDQEWETEVKDIMTPNPPPPPPRPPPSSPLPTFPPFRGVIYGVHGTPDRGICWAQALPEHSNRFALRRLGLRTSSAHRETAGVAMSFLLPERYHPPRALVL